MAVPQVRDPERPALRLIAGGADEPRSGIQGRPEPSDGELLALVRAADPTGFELLYRRYAPFALSLAVRVQGHALDVEDILHDAFLRVTDKIDHLKSDEAFKSWLASIVVSLVRTRLRRRKLLSTLGLESSEALDLDVLAHPSASSEDRAQVAEVYRALLELPVEVRLAWTLRYVEGEKLSAVALITGTSLATAKRRISHAASELDRLLGLSLSDPVSDEMGEPTI